MVLEVGTGTGSLTAMMAAQAAAVVTVEIDAHLFELASEELIDLPNVTMLQLDALRNKNNIDDRVMDAVGEQLLAAPGRRLQARGQSAVQHRHAHALESIAVAARAAFDDGHDSEGAGRADHRSPSTKDYSALSVWIQSQCTAEIVRLMPPSVFWPEPKVTSAILRIVIDPEPKAGSPIYSSFTRSLKRCFLHRRKFLRANVVAALKQHLNKEQVDALLDEMGFAPDTRTEQLDVADTNQPRGQNSRRGAQLETVGWAPPTI